MAYSIDILVGGTASASSQSGGYEATKGCDNNEVTRWSTSNTNMPCWWKYDLGVGITKKVVKLRIKPMVYQGHAFLKDFILQGSNNNSDWVNIYTGQHADNENWEDFIFTNINSYRYYRIWITTNWKPTGGSTIWEIEMMTDNTVFEDFSLGAVIKKTINLQYTLSAYTFWRNYLLNSVLQKPLSDDYSLSAILKKTFSSSYSLLSSILFVERKTDVIDWNIAGEISLGLETGGLKVFSGIAEITKVIASLKDTGSASDTIIDINKNGISIFPAPGDRLDIAFNNTDKYTTYKFTSPVLILEQDKLSIDVDSVATDAEDLNVRVVLRRLTCYPPSIKKIEFYNNLVKQGTTIEPTNTLKVKVIFNIEMNETASPTIALKFEDGTTQDISSGSWTHTNLEYDTFITNNITIASSKVGKAVIEISEVIGRNTLPMNPDVYSSDFDIEEITRIEFENSNLYTNTANNDLVLDYIQATQMKFSLDNATWSAWEDYDTSKTIDITDVSLGGNSVEGVKTVYVKFKTNNGESIAYSTTIKYYYAALSFTFDLIQMGNIIGGNNYRVELVYPDSVAIVPLKSVKIYLNDVLTIEDKMQDTVYGASIKTCSSSLRKITLYAGYVLTRNGIKYTIAEDTEIILDDIPAGNTHRIDLVYVDLEGNLLVKKGDYGLTENALPTATLYPVGASVNTFPKAPEVQDDWIPLYYLYVQYVGATDDTSRISINYTGDLRPTRLIYYLSNLEDDVYEVKVTIEDMAGRTKDVTKSITTLSVPRFGRIRAYTNSGKTVEINSGDPTTLSTIWIVVE